MMDFNQAMKNRRSRYDIKDTSPISDKRIEEILSECITFDVQAFRRSFDHTKMSRKINN